MFGWLFDKNVWEANKIFWEANIFLQGVKAC